ncbi:hypothetical protein [Roseburia inulinivorans]|nr:hypothetical protein [Roseburia inulinivorans]
MEEKIENEYNWRKMMKKYVTGKSCNIGKNVSIDENVVIGHNVIIEDNVSIGANCSIDNNVIIRSNVEIGENSDIGANCILGENSREDCGQFLKIGKKALIRSGSILYTGSNIGEEFQTGHHVTIREKTMIGHHVSVGTLSDIQGNCKIGNYVRLHSNVHIGQLSIIDSFVWIFPYVVLTNDPTPPSEDFRGVHIHSFAIVATGAILMPGVNVLQDALVAAGAIVAKDVQPYSVVAGNPAKEISDVRKIKNKITGENVYPWRNYFKKYMPWQESNFQVWYSTLDIEEKKDYELDRMDKFETGKIDL